MSIYTNLLEVAIEDFMFMFIIVNGRLLNYSKINEFMGLFIFYFCRISPILCQPDDQLVDQTLDSQFYSSDWQHRDQRCPGQNKIGKYCGTDGQEIR